MSISPIAMASGAARPEYRLKLAVASDSSAAMRMPAENVIVSPTRATETTIASWQRCFGGATLLALPPAAAGLALPPAAAGLALPPAAAGPARISSRTRNIRNRA